MIKNDTKRILIISDIHFPFQNDKALNKALQIGKDNKVSKIILNGDIIDFHSISRFEKNPKERNLRQEIETTRNFLYSLRKQFPKIEILYKIGNHEKRLTSYLWSKAEEFSDLPELSLERLLHFKENNIQYYPKDKVIKLGKLSVIHGHELSTGICSVYPSRSLFLGSNTSCIAGHCHRQSSFVKRTLNGNIIKTFTVGCLCNLIADYSTYNDWTNGCAIVELFNNDDFEVKLISF